MAAKRRGGKLVGGGKNQWNQLAALEGRPMKKAKPKAKPKAAYSKPSQAKQRAARQKAAFNKRFAPKK